MTEPGGRRHSPRRWDRLRAFFSRGAGKDALTSADDDRLVIVAESADEAVASSVVLDPSPWRPGEPAVLRHYLAFGGGRAEEAVRVAELNGYQVITGAAGPAGAEFPEDMVAFAKLESFTTVDVSRERSRIASMASRHRGTVLGWQVLQLPE
ncbi:MAG: hypothetical protein WAV90_04885 [Gordonia amarae]